MTAAILTKLCGADLRILGGPFEGMRFIPFASGSGLLPKIAGSYEMEIHPAVAASLRRGYRRVINIGCGEGYYAVGYARALPAAAVYAFDLDILARHRLRRLARLNGAAGRIRVAARCRPEDVEALAGRESLVVCDCEGCEKELLDPFRSPALAAADILVEIHDFIDPSISSIVTERFTASHDIEIFSMRERDAGQILGLERLSPDEQRFAVWEGRPPGMQWAWMRSRAW
jgi:SAM-dependent methyltransferase